MNFDKCLALIFSFLILGQAYLVRRYVGTWLFPACLLGLFWFGFTFFPLAILFWVPVNPYATAFIFLCTLAFSLGSMAFDWKTAFSKNALKRDTASSVYGSPFLKAVFYLTTFLALVFVILDMLAQGVSLRDFFVDFLASASAYNRLRNPDEFTLNVFARWSVVLMYLEPVLGGFLFLCTERKKGRLLIVLLSFFPSAVLAVAQSSKWVLFLSVALFYSGILIYRISAGKLRLFQKGSVKLLTLCALLLSLVATVSFMSRGLYAVDDNEEVGNLLMARFASYSCGHIYGFSDWFSSITGGHSELHYAYEGTTYGFYTFTPVFRVMGSSKVVPMGLFDEYYSFDNIIVGNIYTMFRGLILDFGLVGTPLFMLATGFLLHWAFYTMLCSVRPVFTIAVFVFAVAYFYDSFIASLLNQSGIYLSFMLLCVVLQVNKWIAQRDGRRLAIAMEAATQA